MDKESVPFYTKFNFKRLEKKKPLFTNSNFKNKIFNELDKDLSQNIQQ